jgi:hypothetical protein
MTAPTDDLLPSASACRQMRAQASNKQAADHKRREAEAEQQKKELLEKLSKPSGVSDEERLKRAAAFINGAVRNGLTQVEVGRFPNRLCTDLGRAINQQEAGWEKTLTGVPLEIYKFWQQHLEPRGYSVKYQIKEYVNGMPGDVAITLAWDE